MRWEQCIGKDSKILIFAGADESWPTLLGIVSLAVRFRNRANRAHFLIANRLALNVMVETRFLKAHLNPIGFDATFWFSRAALYSLFCHR